MSPGKTRVSSPGRPYSPHQAPRSSTRSVVRSTSRRSWFLGSETWPSVIERRTRITGGEVEVTQGKPEQLAFAHPALQGDLEEHREQSVLDLVEQTGELLVLEVGGLLLGGAGSLGPREVADGVPRPQSASSMAGLRSWKSSSVALRRRRSLMYGSATAGFGESISLASRCPLKTASAVSDGRTQSPIW